MSIIFSTFVKKKRLMAKDLKVMKCKDLVSFSTEVGNHDTRIDRCKRHEGRTIVFITLCAVLCGWRTWDEICEFGKYKKELMEEYLGKLESTPSADTISRFFALIKPESFEGVYRIWMAEILRLRKSPKGEEPNREVIAIDGKEMCGTAACEGTPVRVVSAFAVKSGISIGQKVVGEKTNEIPAMRELVGELDIKGDIVTADALHCQKDTCEAIVKAGADFFLFVKGNQKFLMKAVADAVDTVMNSKSYMQPAQKTKSYSGKSGKSFCVRSCVAISDLSLIETFRKEWPWIKSFGMITLEREKDGEIVREDRYFITSLRADADLFLKTAREHWGVENGLHWRLDVDFLEDASRKRKNAATNFSVVNKMAIAILGTDKKKEPMRRKRQRASLSDDYLRQLIDNFCLEL